MCRIVFLLLMGQKLDIITGFRYGCLDFFTNEYQLFHSYNGWFFSYFMLCYPVDSTLTHVNRIDTFDGNGF